jgi:hypothetical protein
MRRACAWVQQGAGWCHKPPSGHAGAHVGLVLAVARHPWVQHAAIGCIITHRCLLQICITGEAFLAVLCMALSGHGRVGLLSGARQGSRLPLMGENDSAGCYAGWRVPFGWRLVATALHQCQVPLRVAPVIGPQAIAIWAPGVHSRLPHRLRSPRRVLGEGHLDFWHGCNNCWCCHAEIVCASSQCVFSRCMRACVERLHERWQSVRVQVATQLLTSSACFAIAALLTASVLVSL